MSLFRCLLRGTSSRNTPPRRSEWGSSLPPDCFVSRGSISPCEYFLTWVFHREALLAPRPTPRLEDHPLSAVRDCLFNLFAATLHIGGRSSTRNLRTLHAVVTGTHLSHGCLMSYIRYYHNLVYISERNSHLVEITTYLHDVEFSRSLWVCIKSTCVPNNNFQLCHNLCIYNASSLQNST